ncbi:MAG TPA: periplasmic heavy metal sensor [Thermoanaerobaculia bacterium]|jgi:Spy/CpxP family protein refolding chaperone|nr:periplasmic heavy metal sensor [Thermoanaerobaculia bacterium]
MKNRKLMIAIALLTLLAIPFVANAAADKGPRNPADILHNARALAKYLKLTPAQIETTKGLLEDLHATTKPLYDQIEPLETQLHSQLDAASPDACAVGATVVKIDALRDQIRDARQDFDAAFSAILTPAQLAKYEALKDLLKPGDEED